MLLTKKAKIRKHLEAVGKENWSAFEWLLSDYLDGKLSEKLQRIGVEKQEIHIDFLADYKCIGIQGKYKQNYVDIQIEENGFHIGCDPVEPDEHAFYPLESEASFYTIVSQKLSV